MYIPKQYQIHDYEMIKSFMNEHNFVTIVTYNGTTPIATHLPVNIEENIMNYTFRVTLLKVMNNGKRSIRISKY